MAHSDFHDLDDELKPKPQNRIGYKRRSDDGGREFIFTSPQFADFGIEENQVKGRIIRVYSPSKTVADCFKYRNKVGFDVAMEALSNAWRKRLITMDELWRLAIINRITNVMLPFVQMLVRDYWELNQSSVFC